MKTINEYNAIKIIKAYEVIEQGLLDFLNVVPLDNKNKGTWSPKLINALLDIGSLVDSVFRSAAPIETTRANGKIIKRQDMTMTDYRKIFSSRFKLEGVRTLVYITPPIVLEPFKDFKSKSPEWWKIYNKVKHDRLKNASLTTIEVALNATAGLFQLIVQYPPMFPYLVRQEWFDSNYNLDIAMPIMSSEDRLEKMPKQGIHETFLIQTKLFATTIGKRVLPEKIQDINPIDYWPYTKIMTFVGRGFG